MLKIAICDDETIFLTKIRNLLKECMEQRKLKYEINCYASGGQLLEQIKRHQDYGMIFLAVDMKQADGMELAKAIRMLSERVPIIFVARELTSVVDGYKVDALRCLLKDDDNLKEALFECIDAVWERLNPDGEWYKFKFRSGEISLPLDRILYVESRLHKLIFYVLEEGIKEYHTYNKLDMIENMLSGKGFFRIHQSFLVNMAHVQSVERYKAKLKEGSEISISKRYYKAVEREYRERR